MTILEYNLRIIMGHILVIIAVIWIFGDFYKFAKGENIKRIYLVGMIIFSIIFITSMTASIAYNNQIVTVGTVTDITCTGSWAGLMDSYTISVIQSNGEIVDYDTSIFSSATLKTAVSELSVGDKIEIYANTVLNILYNFQLCT